MTDDVVSPTSDRKSTRLNSSHTVISYAVFCLKKKNKIQTSIHITTRTPNDESQQLLAHTHTARRIDLPSTPVCYTSVSASFALFFFFNDPATPEIYPLSLHDALPICLSRGFCDNPRRRRLPLARTDDRRAD